MAHGQPHEEAEHAQHHAADPFDKRVAMTMVVIAALLAGVKVLGHRTHNDTLGYQIKAGVTNTEASNLWNFFQAKKMRRSPRPLRGQPAARRGAARQGPAGEGGPDRLGRALRTS